MKLSLTSLLSGSPERSPEPAPVPLLPELEWNQLWTAVNTEVNAMSNAELAIRNHPKTFGGLEQRIGGDAIQNVPAKHVTPVVYENPTEATPATRMERAFEYIGFPAATVVNNPDKAVPQPSPKPSLTDENPLLDMAAIRRDIEAATVGQTMPGDFDVPQAA